MVVVKLTNDNNSVSRVPLRKPGFGHIGRGEYCSTLPSEERSRPVYGLKPVRGRLLM
jgi:hypothetical protein